MCVAIPGRVIEVSGGKAVVDIDGRPQQISAIAIPELAAGDYVLISLGMALEKITQEEAAELAGLWADVAIAMESS